MFLLCYIISNKAQSKGRGIQLSKHLSCIIKKNQKTPGITSNRVRKKETTEAITSDFAEGLRRMLVSLYGHTSNTVLSSTMAAKLLADGERFMFSH